MPKVSQEHLDARRQQIVDAARARFAGHGFARTSMADIVTESGLSNGAIYRYFTSKDEIVVAVCEQGSEALPKALTAEAVAAFLAHVRTRARETGHARLVAQIYAEAAVSPQLAALVRQQLATLRATVAALVPARRRQHAEQIAEGFVALCVSYSQQLAIRGDLDPAPFTASLMAIVEGAPDNRATG
ncbi:TetR/AcrR family transcriptional regulator [Streptomyces tsukubensis]|uniref:TetR family transcriptional regulator n=1 Tax=Streptomyces tsukubensis TaxID=83656 RepID=A0A1V4AEU9_9ACTN|nr:TetR/AcrR family transcriptional regulator [Streptomyces tsukubensis]OON82624.1 TetR family transcriptional regulator [Streptomyces tsukubensis]QFR92203.1 TetR family transcriptional regulator [Streptomyces tsukubensis]